MSGHQCPACGQPNMRVFYRQPSVPANSCILLKTREEAIGYPRGRIELAFCPACGFISNLAFEPQLTEYSGRYEETQGFSGTFNQFHHALALRLIEDYGLRGKRVLEIGCGKGEFLKLICELGNNEGIGFDPGFREDRLNLEGMDRIRVIKDFYSDKYSNYSADFLCCKMTLEHIFDAGDFIGTVRKAIGNDGTYVFFQIPEVTRILNECAFEDIYYEHCSYFSPGSLARLFRSKGFDVLAVKKEYGDQYLTIEARAGGSYAPGPELAEEDDLQFLRDSVATFPMRCEKKLARWRGCLADYARKGSKVVLWGSGSKGVSFLTTLHSGQAIEYVVDINPHRQGYFMSGTGQEIVSPEFLQGYKPDVVIVMNAIYCDEILRQLEELQLSPHLIAV